MNGISPAPAGQTEKLTLPFEPLPQFRRHALEETPERAANRGKRIGIFIVAYNALTTLSKVLKRITPEVWKNVEQVAVFDDASQDPTYELAVGIQALTNLPKLRVLRHAKNLGYGGNQKAGYRYFLEQGFDIVVLLHGDGQYAPELLSHMYAPLVRGEADAVFGSRMMKEFGGPLQGGMPLYKFLGNRVLTAIENRALGLHLTEFHSGYRAYNLHALREIDFGKMTDDFHFDTQIIVKLHHQLFRIVEVPIPTFYGDEICYVNGLKYAKAILRSVYRYKAAVRSARSYPEYEEYFVSYAAKRSLYSATYYAARLAGSGSRVLEVGCENVFDLDKQSGVFDRVLVLDVLEHLRDPAGLLEACKKLLAPRGKLIVSVPNAVNLTVRLMILFGGFRYRNRGILDWTHLRFFTAATIRELLERQGYRVTARHRTVMPLERVIPLDAGGRPLRWGSHVLRMLTALMPGLLAYEIVLAAEKRDRPGVGNT
ncbi:MAG: glycosyltransferase [Bryobacteraceae bacterium]